MMQVINPSNGELVKTYQEYTTKEVDEIINLSYYTFKGWQKSSFKERSALMNNAAGVLRSNIEKYAQLMAVEMGKPINDGRAEIEKCAWICDYYAEHAESFLGRRKIATEASESFVSFQPLGTILAVMPWNFPFWQVFRFAAPGLMAGNVGLLKHASNVPGSALAIEEVFHEAGFPDGCFKTLLIGSQTVASVIENPIVKAVTITGSTLAGKAVASKAGEMLKKTVLELGGSDPYIILKDANISEAAASCSASRLINAGQSCIAAKRFIAVKDIIEEFQSLFVKHMKAAIMGNPLSENTTIGPQARIDLRDELHHQVENSIKLGAKVLLGGKIPAGKGAFYPPTVLSEVKKGMPAYDEELFGPVAAIITAKDETEAVEKANDSIFGLGAAVFTSNKSIGKTIAETQLEAGSCFVNSFVKSDPRLPFGGIKDSGYGRELSSYGIQEFVNIKTVYIK
jgi:succinate-semialdehyde dehydrogenase/glutarate-semialdehyde dehydrogenase